MKFGRDAHFVIDPEMADRMALFAERVGAHSLSAAWRMVVTLGLSSGENLDGEFMAQAYKEGVKKGYESLMEGLGKMRKAVE